MIILYSGTPGSGKSLNTASHIYANLKLGSNQIICNFPINERMFSEKQLAKFQYRDNQHITPNFLVEYSKEYFEKNSPSGVKGKEGKIRLYLDEAQLMFNTRDWNTIHKQGWSAFFTQHRHLGYDIYLITQFDKMLDKQLLALIEYEYKHRKLSNFGWKGKLFSLFIGLGRPLFICVKYWYPMREKVGSEFFRFSRKLDGLYDTHMLIGFDDKNEVKEQKKEEVKVLEEHSTQEEGDEKPDDLELDHKCCNTWSENTMKIVKKLSKIKGLKAIFKFTQKN